MTSLIPKSKLDLDSVERIRATPPTELVALLPELMLWTQDSNWPVAQSLAPVLAQLGRATALEITKILASTDDGWKFAVLTLFPEYMSHSDRDIIMDDVLRIMRSPTEGEKAEGLDEIAHDVAILHANDRPN